jgi:hypothetical protein
MLQRGDRVPHFTARRQDGSEVRYETQIWQQRNLLLVSIPGGRDEGGFAEYSRQLTERAADIAATETAIVITGAGIAGVPRPGVVMADRWGEIAFAVEAARASDLPVVDEILEWLRFVQHKCPECEGEAR